MGILQNLLASAEIENGICTYAVRPSICAMKLSQPSYLYQTQPPPAKPVHQPICPNFVGSLFRLLRYRPRYQGETPFIPRWKPSKTLMGVRSKQNIQLCSKSLNQSVIKPAIKEINALTDYHVEAESQTSWPSRSVN